MSFSRRVSFGLLKDIYARASVATYIRDNVLQTGDVVYSRLGPEYSKRCCNVVEVGFDVCETLRLSCVRQVPRNYRASRKHLQPYTPRNRPRIMT